MRAYVCVCVWLVVHYMISGCVLLTLSVWSICSLMEVARAKCRAPSCCPRHPRWHALCPSPCPTLKPSARPLTADSAHPHLRVSHPHSHSPPQTPPLLPRLLQRNCRWLAINLSFIPNYFKSRMQGFYRCSHHRNPSFSQHTGACLCCPLVQIISKQSFGTSTMATAVVFHSLAVSSYSIKVAVRSLRHSAAPGA